MVSNDRTFLKIRTTTRLVKNHPPTSPNPNKCLMQDVFVVLHIPGAHMLWPTASTVHGVNICFIPSKTENGDERLDCACTVVTIIDLNLCLPWLDASEQGCSGAAIIPVNPCPFDLSNFKKCDLLRVFSNCQRASGLQLQTNTVAFSSTHMKCCWIESWREKEWATKLQCEGLWHVSLLDEYRQANAHARLKTRIDCAGCGRPTYRAPTSHGAQTRARIKKWREGQLEKAQFLPQARLFCSATRLFKIIQSYSVLDIFNPNRHLPHSPTSERYSDFQKSLVMGRMHNGGP